MSHKKDDAVKDCPVPEEPTVETPARCWQKITAAVREELAKADLCAMDGPGTIGGAQMVAYQLAVKQAMENEAAALAFGAENEAASAFGSK